MTSVGAGLKGHLIQIDTTTRENLPAVRRFASMDDPDLCHFDGLEWLPGIQRLPALRYDFFGGDFNGQITTPTASFNLILEWIEDFANLRFSGARVRVWSGTIGNLFRDWDLRFDGVISSAPGVEAGIASFTAKPNDLWLDKPLLPLFTGFGAMEGTMDLEGQVKPWILGACRLVPGVLIDAVNNVYRLNGTGSVQAISYAYDRLVDLGTPTANYADMTALVGATIPNGRWATCLAYGLVRLGAPAEGAVSFDVSGDNAGAGGFVRLPGQIIGRVAELAGGTVDQASLDELDRLRPWQLSLLLNSQTTARRVIQEIADSVVAVPMVGWTGKLIVKPLGFGTPDLDLQSDGTAWPPVGGISELPVDSPFWRVATNCELTWRVHNQNEIAFSAPFVERGPYSASETYREGNIVSTSDGSRYLYINTNATSGNAPPNGTYWFLLSTAPGVAFNIVYRKAASKPSVPSPSPGVPSGWADEISGVAAGDQPVWAVSGTKAAGATNFVWEAVTAAAGDSRLWDAIDTGGAVKDDQVGTGAITDEGVNKSSYVESSSVLALASATKTQLLSLSITKAISDSALRVFTMLGFIGPDAVDGNVTIEILSGASVVASRVRGLQFDCNEATQVPVPVGAFFAGLGAGSYTAKVYFTRTTGNSCSTDGTYSLEVTEQKR